jgi:hypothetical protein
MQRVARGCKKLTGETASIVNDFNRPFIAGIAGRGVTGSPVIFHWNARKLLF